MIHVRGESEARGGFPAPVVCEEIAEAILGERDVRAVRQQCADFTPHGVLVEGRGGLREDAACDGEDVGGVHVVQFSVLSSQ